MAELTTEAKPCILNTRSKMRTSWSLLGKAPRAKDAFEKIRLRNSDTPDIPFIDHYRGHLLFVYGTMKAGFSRNYLLTSEKAEFISVATTQHTYALYYDAEGVQERYPVLLPAIGRAEAGWVVGQLWMVYPKTIFGTDEMERNGRLYKRMKVQTQIVSKPKNKQFQQYAVVFAWTYMGIMDTWRQKILSGEMVSVPRSQLFNEGDREAYINFTKKHCYLDASTQ